MRLNKLCKQVLSVALAAALAVGTPIAVGPQTVKAETTTDTTVTAPTPLLALDFENGTLTDGKYTEEDVEFTAVGSPSITIDPNNSGNKVLALSEDSNGAKGTEYLSSTLGALGKGKFDKGFTISMSVRPNAITAASADWTYMWGAGHKAGDSADKNAEYSYIDCAAGMIARYGDVKNSLETPDATGFVTKSIQLFPGNNYVDGNPLNAGNTVERNRYNYFFGKDQPGVGKWSTLTFVYSKSEIALYVNGIKTVKWTVRKEYESDVERIIKSISTGRLNLGTSANGFDYSACFSGYMDDVKVFDGALTAEEIAALIPKVESVKIKAEGSTAEGTEKDPVVVKNINYYTGDKKTGYKLGEVQLNAEVSPSNAVDSEATWSLSGENGLAEIDAKTGKITVLKDEEGSFQVTAQVGNNKSATCYVKIETEKKTVDEVKSVSVDNQTLYLGMSNDGTGTKVPGQSVTVIPKFDPVDVSVKDVRLTTKDVDKISINGCKITPLAKGEATVTVTSVANDEIHSDFKVVVNDYTFGKATANSIQCEAWPKCIYSGWEELKGNFSIEYNFRNVCKGAGRAQNFGVVLTDGTRRARFRGDQAINPENKADGENGVSKDCLLVDQQEAWGTDQDKFNESVWSSTANIDTWTADMKKGANVKATITREGQNLTVSYYYNADSGNEYFMTAKTELVKGTENLPLYVALSGEVCELSNITLAPANQSVELGIGGSKEYKVSDILPVATVGDEIKTVPPATGTVSATGAAVEAKSDIVDIKTGTDSVTVTGLKVGSETIKVTDEKSGMSFTIKVNVSDDSAAPTPTTSPAPSQDPGTASGPAVTPGEPTQAPTTSDTPGSSDTPGTTPSEPTATPGNNDDNTGDDEKNEPQATTATVNKGGAKTTVKTTENGTAAIKKVKSSKKSVTVSSTVKVEGVEYKVTTIEANAFANCKKATKITLPSTVKTIKKKAFTGAKKVKTIVVKSKKAVTVKKGAFKGINTKKITIKASKMSKKQLKKFKKTLKKAGFKGKVKK